MRGLREQPRAVVARLLGAVGLVVIGVLIGGAVHSDRSDEVHAAQVRLVSVQRSRAALNNELQRRTRERDRAVADRVGTERTVRSLRRDNSRLRRELKAARRTRHHTKQHH